MVTTVNHSAATFPAPSTLLADYERWLEFITTSRFTIREHDRQLALMAATYSDLRQWIDYLRGCMHQRTQFFGSVAILLTAKVAQLRNEPTNIDLIRRLTNAQPIMQALVSQLSEAFAEVEEAYQRLLTT